MSQWFQSSNGGRGLLSETRNRRVASRPAGCRRCQGIKAALRGFGGLRHLLLVHAQAIEFAGQRLDRRFGARFFSFGLLLADIGRGEAEAIFAFACAADHAFEAAEASFQLFQGQGLRFRIAGRPSLGEYSIVTFTSGPRDSLVSPAGSVMFSGKLTVTLIGSPAR